MRQVLSFAFLVCAIHASFVYSNEKDEILSQLKTLQSEVKNITADLRTFQDGLLTGSLTKALGEQDEVLKKKFENKNKIILEELEIKYDELKRKGIDADVCYKTATEKLNTIYENTTENLGLFQLEAYGLKTISLGNNIDYILKMGNNLIQRFDSVIEECSLMGDKLSHEINCLNRSLSAVKILGTNLKKVAKDMKESAFDFSRQAVLKTKTAALEAIEKLDEESLKIKDEFIHCGFNA